MAFSMYKILKGLLIKEENTQTPKEIEIVPGGTAGFKTTILSSTSSSNKTLTLPNATDTLMGQATTDIMTNKTFDADGTGNSITNIEDADIKSGAAINASKIANGTVDNTEFEYLNGVTSSIQTQLNTNATDISNHLSDAIDAHAASAIGNTPTGNLGATTVQAALNELQSDVDGRATSASPVFTGDIDGSASTNVDLATTNSASTVDIGTGSGANTINLGGLSTTINMYGTVNNQNVTNLNVTDKLITINDGGATSSGFGAGFEIEENASATGYFKTSTDRNSFEIKAPNTAGILSLTPGATNDVVTMNAASQTLTNKTLTSPSLTTPSTDILTLDGQASTPANPSSGFYKAYVKDSTQKLTILDSAGVETTVGSGSGSNNYITANDGTVIGSWTTYADAAGTSPVDGTGGSPNVTFAVSTNSSLRGTSNFLFTHDAANRQGQGFSYDFTIDPADATKVLQCSFDYLVASGTYADNDLTFWVYDVTNSTLIQPAPYQLKNVSSAEKFFFEFQATTSTSYRLIGHVSTSTATAYTIRFDDFNLSRQAKLYGSPVTDWISFTPTGSWTSNVTYYGKWRRVGDSMQIQTQVVCSGVPTATSLTLNLPSGYSIDTTKLAYSTTFDQTSLGTGIATDSGTQNYSSVSVGYSSTTAVRPLVGTASSYVNGTFITEAVPFSFNTSDSVTVSYQVPILGWSSSVQMSNDADNRVVATRAYVGSNQSISNASLTKVNVDSVSFDSNGTYDTANKKYVAPLPGTYDVSVVWQFAANSTGQRVAYIYKNGSVYAQMNGSGNSSAGAAVVTSLVNMIAGDYLEFYAFQDSGGSLTLYSSSSNSFVSIQRLSGPSQIAANEVICARYSSSAGQSIANNSVTIVDFGTKEFDSHGSVTTGSSWKFTSPTSGKFLVNTTVGTNTPSAWADTEQYSVYIYKNGSTDTTLGNITSHATSSHYPTITGSSLVSMNAGDYVDIRVYQSTGGSINLHTNSSWVIVSICRIGN